MSRREPLGSAPLDVAVIGLWHLGSVCSACLASLGHFVRGVDDDPHCIERLTKGIAPVYEPGLNELLAAQIADGRLTFTTDLEGAVGTSDVIVVAHDTPVSEMDEVDITLISTTVQRILPIIRDDAALAIFSQVPVGTCGRLLESLKSFREGRVGGIAYVPENLRLGQALDRFLHPDMVVIGVQDSHTDALVHQLLTGIDAPKVRTDLATAEMVKHAINGFLATCISFANEVAALCEVSGADATQVAAALKMDRRVGRGAPLSPGAGFSGGTLGRDVSILRCLGRSAEVDSSILDAVVAVNERQRLLPLTWLKGVFGGLLGLQIGVLGLTYKPGTSSLRRSAALDLIRRFVQEGAQVEASDPKADFDEVKDLPPFRFSRDPYTIARGKDALLIMTPWPEFGELDYRDIKARMRQPVVFDMPNMLNPRTLADIGFRYFGVGRRY